MISFLFSRAGAALIGIVVALGLLTFSHRFAYQAGRQVEREALLTRSVEILRERNRVDEKVKDMDAAALCAALGGMPDECAGFGL